MSLLGGVLFAPVPSRSPSDVCVGGGGIKVTWLSFRLAVTSDLFETLPVDCLG